MPPCCWLHTNSASPQQAALLPLLALTYRNQSRHPLLLHRQAAALLLHCRLCFSCGSSLQQQWQQVLCRQAAAQPSLLNSSW
jgi:hypothetical protein